MLPAPVEQSVKLCNALNRRNGGCIKCVDCHTLMKFLSCSCRLSDHAGTARLLLLPGLWLLPLPLRLCLQAANAAQACCQSSGARARATASSTEAVKRSREMMLPGELPRKLPSELLQSSRAQQTSGWSKRKTGQHSIQQCRPQPQVGCAAAQQQHRGSRRRT